MLKNIYGSSYEYQYDGLNRLTLAEGQYDDGTMSGKSYKRGYEFASNGNLIKKKYYTPETSTITDTWDYTYSAHRATTVASSEAGANVFNNTYDAIGNITVGVNSATNDTTNYTFDSQNRLIMVTNPDAVPTYEQTVGTYYYDDQGFRVRKFGRREIDVSGTPTYREFELLYPNMYFGIERQNDDLGQEIAGTWNVVNNIYVDGLRIAAYSGAGTGGGQARFFLTDQVDSVKLVVDQTGDVVSRQEYYPYGESFVTENTTAEEYAPKYNSQEKDLESDLYYYNARYYGDKLSRFQSADTIIDGEMDTQGWNRYSYVKGNPIRYKDPTGHAADEDVNQKLEDFNTETPITTKKLTNPRIVAFYNTFFGIGESEKGVRDVKVVGYSQVTRLQNAVSKTFGGDGVGGQAALGANLVHITDKLTSKLTPTDNNRSATASFSDLGHELSHRLDFNKKGGVTKFLDQTVFRPGETDTELKARAAELSISRLLRSNPNILTLLTNTGEKGKEDDIKKITQITKDWIKLSEPDQNQAVWDSMGDTLKAMNKAKEAEKEKNTSE